MLTGTLVTLALIGSASPEAWLLLRSAANRSDEMAGAAAVTAPAISAQLYIEQGESCMLPAELPCLLGY